MEVHRIDWQSEKHLRFQILCGDKRRTIFMLVFFWKYNSLLLREILAKGLKNLVNKMSKVEWCLLQLLFCRTSRVLSCMALRHCARPTLLFLGGKYGCYIIFSFLWNELHRLHSGPFTLPPCAEKKGARAEHWMYSLCTAHQSVEVESERPPTNNFLCINASWPLAVRRQPLI